MAAAWTVTRQDQDQYDFTTPGDPVLGALVHFVTGEGNSGTVFIPYNHYHPQQVRQMIHARAEIIDEIGRLESGT